MSENTYLPDVCCGRGNAIHTLGVCVSGLACRYPGAGNFGLRIRLYEHNALHTPHTRPCDKASPSVWRFCSEKPLWPQSPRLIYTSTEIYRETKTQPTQNVKSDTVRNKYSLNSWHIIFGVGTKKIGKYQSRKWKT